MEATITLQNLSIGYRSKKKDLRVIASAINASLLSDELTCLIGSNGVGKSTLLRTLAGFQPPLEGEVLLQGNPLSTYSAQEMAKEVSVVLTSKLDIAQLSVTDVVGMGRSPYTGFFGTLSSSDKQVIAEALYQVGISHLADHNIQELSDGERQKVMIAKALAQQTSLIILDEPTAFLDFPSKVETMQMLRRLAHNQDQSAHKQKQSAHKQKQSVHNLHKSRSLQEQHKSILLSTHDVELALQIADRIWLMEPGRLSIGTPRELSADGSLSKFIERDGIKYDKERMRIEINNQI